MLRVLVVEDEEIIRKGFIHTVDWTGMECVIVGEARNGKEGLEKIQELRPDIVFTDIIMPKMNGIEMLEAAKDEYEFNKKPLSLEYLSIFLNL